MLCVGRVVGWLYLGVLWGCGVCGLGVFNAPSMYNISMFDTMTTLVAMSTFRYQEYRLRYAKITSLFIGLVHCRLGLVSLLGR